VDPVLCHQPLDYLTKLVVRAKVQAPAKTNKFEAFSDRWMVTLGHMFGVVLDPGNFIKKVWSLPIPEGLKEVLWKEMNGALVIGHRYYGSGHAKSDMGRYCPCGMEMSLGHILVGCSAYKLQPLMDALMDVLHSFQEPRGFKTLTPDEWGVSPWYPLLALRELEELVFPFVKGRKAILKELKGSRQRRIWVVGTYYWALWKWRMKEIHDAGFNFLPRHCAAQLREMLVAPIPPHMLQESAEDGGNGGAHDSGVRPLPTRGVGASPPGQPSQTLQPLQVCEAPRPTAKGESILRAFRVPAAPGGSRLSRRDAILRVLTDDAYR